MLALLTLVVTEDTVPKDEDVVAGPVGALFFVLLIAATIFLCFSFVKQLRKAKAAQDEGLFGDQPAQADGTSQPGSDSSADTN